MDGKTVGRAIECATHAQLTAPGLFEVGTTTKKGVCVCRMQPRREEDESLQAPDSSAPVDSPRWHPEVTVGAQLEASAPGQH
jgi:hypothetical protein